jgi:hypothetical protein
MHAEYEGAPDVSFEDIPRTEPFYRVLLDLQEIGEKFQCEWIEDDDNRAVAGLYYSYSHGDKKFVSFIGYNSGTKKYYESWQTLEKRHHWSSRLTMQA